MSIPRDRTFEARAVRQLAGTIPGLNVEPLIRLACQRADEHEGVYGHDFPNLERDLEAEGMFEGADWCQYIVWRLDGIHRGLFPEEDWKVEHLQTALRYVALAFEATRAARG